MGKSSGWYPNPENHLKKLNKILQVERKKIRFIYPYLSLLRETPKNITRHQLSGIVMSIQSSTIVQRLWNYCNVLRDDGMSYGDYVEQLTYLLFLKMDDEKARMLGKPSSIPDDFDWQSLLTPGRR